MKSTGIIRRVDDLGRVVIPKEIRRGLKIREGDPLEIFATENGVCFCKYKVHESINPENIALGMKRAGLIGFVVDREGLTIGGENKESIDLPEDMRDFKSPTVLREDSKYFVYPLISDGDWIAAMIVKNISPMDCEIAHGIATMALV